MGLAEMYVVRVHVDRAEGFHIAEEKGSIDRYCAIYVGDQILTTRGIHDSANPVSISPNISFARSLVVLKKKTILLDLG